MYVCMYDRAGDTAELKNTTFLDFWSNSTTAINETTDSCYALQLSVCNNGCKWCSVLADSADRSLLSL